MDKEKIINFVKSLTSIISAKYQFKKRKYIEMWPSFYTWTDG